MPQANVINLTDKVGEIDPHKNQIRSTQPFNMAMIKVNIKNTAPEPRVNKGAYLTSYFYLPK